MTDLCCFPDCRQPATADVVVNACRCCRSCAAHAEALAWIWEREWPVGKEGER